jgi:arylsulfatase A
MHRNAIVSLAITLCLLGGTATARPTNVILILADDLGINPVGAYGNPYAHTPVLDQLAKDGVLFSTAYAASPVCSPTRATIMTGKTPARTRITDFISGTPYPYARLLQPKWRRSLPLKEKTLPEILVERGYVTGLFGKWHLAKGYHSLAEGPDRQGFQETFITHKPEKDFDPEADAHGVTAIKERSLDFIERHQDKPFFLFISPNTIHNPVMAPAVLVEKHRQRPGADDPRNHPTIAAMMEQLDDALGEIFAKLDALKLTNDTLVIFASDNGGSLKDASQAPLRGGKAQLYEGGLRVPLIIRWTGKLPANRVLDYPTMSADFFATILDATQTPAPDDDVRDGVSLLPVMAESQPATSRVLAWHYPHYHGAGIHGPASAIRVGDWKYIRYYESELTGEGAPAELFNLRNDPGETTNLAATEPARLRELSDQLSTWLESVDAQLPQVNPDFDPARATVGR